MIFCIFEGIQFLAFLANRYKNLENGKTLSSFFKYSPNIFSENFVVRKSVKRKFRPLFSFFFHCVNDRCTMRYTMRHFWSFFLKKYWIPWNWNLIIWNFERDKIISRTKVIKIFWSDCNFVQLIILSDKVLRKYINFFFP